MQAMPKDTISGTVDPDEIARFSRLSDQWWDERGPFAPIHRLTPARMRYIKGVICAHTGRDESALKALNGLRAIDIGCGGGLAAEPLARMGANVTGIDADPNAIAAANAHAALSELDITYLNASTADLPAAHRGRYDVVLALEIVEHVSDTGRFVADCAALCAPGGLVIFSTLNRTLKSLALAKVAAEYLLRWVPAGTHDWRKFIKPHDLAASLRHAGLKPIELRGLVFDPLRNDFYISETDLSVNYFIVAQKEEAP